MKPLPWARSALALCIMGTLTACGGGGANENNEGDVVVTPPPQSSSSSSGGSSSGGSSGGGAEGPILSENFGDDLFVNFDEADTQFFFSQDYKALDANNAADAWPSFYYPTCCFFLNDNPADGVEVSLDQMGIVSDSGNPAMLLNTGRFTAGQTRPEIDDADPKKDSTTSDDVTTWGELDLSQPYRISFCVKDSSGTRNMQVYVDNNTSGEANSTWGGGSSGSRIFNVPAGDLIPGKRVQINVPGDIAYEQGGEAKDFRPDQVGSTSSFLQFRVEGGSSVIFDDLLVERQEDDGQSELPACNVFQPAVAPEAPEAPILIAGDAQISVNWSEVVGAASYELAWGTSSDINAATIVTDITEPTYTLETLDNGTEYFVFVRARNSVGASDWTEVASATPVAPLGCAPTKAADITGSVAWSVWDGCQSPDTSGALVLNAATSGELSYPGDENEVLFKANMDGTSTLDSTADGDARSKGDLGDILPESYPQHFTMIARVDVSKSSGRGLEVETRFNAPSDSRVKFILRPDQGEAGRIQLERFMNFGESSSSSDDTTQVDVPMTGENEGYHIYHVSYTVEDPEAVVGDNNVTVRVYRDGENISGDFNLGVVGDAIVGTGRSGGGGANRIRVGEDSSAGYYAAVDWMVWSNDPLVAAMTPEQLKGELPATIGELDVYGGSDPSAVLEENFSGAGLVEDSETEDTNFFTVDYKTIAGDASKPLYNVTGGSSNIVVAGGTITYGNARFTIGETAPGVATAAETAPNGSLDLSKPYVISFNVITNGNTSADTGKCQVYVDNNTSSSGNSLHGGDSKIFESVSTVMTDEGSPTGTVTITSDPADHIGTATSFVQLRCDSGTGDVPVTIDNFKISYQ